MLERPLSSPRAYADFLASTEIPVLRSSRQTLQALHEASDDFNSRRLAAAVLDDPLLSGALLRQIQNPQRRQRTHDIINIDQCLLMMGVEKFFTFVEEQPHLEAYFVDDAAWLSALARDIDHTRSWVRRAFLLSQLRHDRDPEEIATAAALRQLTRHLLSIHAAPLLKRATGGAHTFANTRDLGPILECSEGEIHRELMRRWNMPDELLRLGGDSSEQSPRMRTLELAKRLNEMLEEGGWHGPGMPALVSQLTALLPHSGSELLKRLDAPTELHDHLLADGHRLE